MLKKVRVYERQNRKFFQTLSEDREWRYRGDVGWQFVPLLLSWTEPETGNVRLPTVLTVGD